MVEYARILMNASTNSIIVIHWLSASTRQVHLIVSVKKAGLDMVPMFTGAKISMSVKPTRTIAVRTRHA